MSKKSTAARSGAQRNKPKAQKGFELVRPVSATQEVETAARVDEPTGVGVATASTSESTIPQAIPTVASMASLPVVPKAKRSATSARIATEAAPAVTEERIVPEMPVDAPKGSAAARLAARRQAAQRTQQKNAATLITPEHYAYVRKDLIFIATLAIIMFAIILILYFIPGLGV